MGSPIALHAACGLLEKDGIYIVGGRKQGELWVTEHFFFDLKETEMKNKMPMPKGLFGPSMTKPLRTSTGEIFFYVAGGAFDSNKTEVYQYCQT